MKNVNKFRTMVKRERKLIGRTKLITKDKQGDLIGKLIFNQFDYEMIIDLRFNDKGLEVFSIGIDEYKMVKGGYYYGKPITMKSYIKDIRTRVNKWRKKQSGSHGSKYTTLIPYDEVYKYLNLNLINDQSTDKLMDNLCTEFKLDEMVVDLTAKGACGRVDKYDYYILTNTITNDLFSSDTKYIILK